MQIEEGVIIIRKPNTIIDAFSFKVINILQASIPTPIDVKF